MVKVKVCGITRVDDALLAGDLGASAIGFVFWPRSPRYLSPTKAQAIAARLPGDVAPVGVFVDPTADEVRQVGGGGRAGRRATPRRRAAGLLPADCPTG